MTQVRSIRSSPEEWARWAEAASGSLSLNAWCRERLNEAADVELARRVRAAAETAERERLLSVSRGL